MTVNPKIDENELDYGKNPPDLPRIKEAWQDLINNKIHTDFLCFCPSCLYQAHKKDGGRFDKDVFFLDWLHFEIKLSLINQRTTYSLDSPGFNPKTSVDMFELAEVRGSVKALSEFIEKNFPNDFNPNYKRIKKRLWRFRKSSTLKALEIKKTLEWFKNHPSESQKESLKNLNLAQRIADFIYSMPGRKVIQRDILRRFFQKKRLEDLEYLIPWLRDNYGIICEEGKRKDQVIYCGVLKTSRGRFLRFGAPSKKIDCQDFL